MAAHVALHAERTVTAVEGAFEWTFARVAVNMNPEAAGASETPPTVRTGISGRRRRLEIHQPRWYDRAGT